MAVSSLRARVDQLFVTSGTYFLAHGQPPDWFGAWHREVVDVMKVASGGLHGAAELRRRFEALLLPAMSYGDTSQRALYAYINDVRSILADLVGLLEAVDARPSGIRPARGAAAPVGVEHRNREALAIGSVVAGGS